MTHWTAVEPPAEPDCPSCGHVSHVPGCCKAWGFRIDFKTPDASKCWGCECEAGQ